MNLILFSEEEKNAPLSLDDPRARHLLQTLRRKEGETFDAGLLNGPRLKGTIAGITPEAIRLDFRPAGDPPPLAPVALLVGLPRPQTARKILQEVTSLGVSEIHFVRTEKGEPSYRESRLWSTGEYRRHLLAGAEQAFTTRIPEVSHHENLAAALDVLTVGYNGAALDNYEFTASLRDYSPGGESTFLAVGAERGWSGAERDLFRSNDIPLVQLGTNVLRTETACLCGLALLLAKLQCI